MNNQKIKKGHTIREYGYGVFVDSEVITEPIENERGQLVFKSVTKQGYVIDYMKSRASLEIIGEINKEECK